jgi:hypothetical protein
MNEIIINDKTHYPRGVEYRTPRPRGTMAGVFLGGLLGLALSRNAGGTLAGSTIGGLLANHPLSLPDAVRQKFQEKGYPILQFYRNGHFGAKVTFKFQNIFVILKSQAPRFPEMTLEQLEDWIYGDLTEQKLENILIKLHAEYGIERIA